MLLAEKEEGMHILQIALDNLQMVLPNTSVAGRDAMRRDMQAMQQDYDALSGRLVDARSSLDEILLNVYPRLGCPEIHLQSSCKYSRIHDNITLN